MTTAPWIMLESGREKKLSCGIVWACQHQHG
jgi:hypothetical protein